ncbi:MAG: class II fumarate hydratase [Nitrososphaerales archaeon]
MDDLNEDYRVESDTLGEVRVPATAYYGAQTQRALENFQISNLKFPSIFIRALALIKLAAAKTNITLGLLDKQIGEAIIKACEELLNGKFDDQFPLDVFQTGSGTSTNMNVNEVLANRASEILGGSRGDKKLVHPNDHVNMCQSTNDVFPTAINIASLETLKKDLLPSMRLLRDAFKRKVEEFKDVIKSARTHLQDAVPITLGQEFSGYESMVEHAIRRVESTQDSLCEIPLGGTAVGTGLNAHPSYAALTIAELNRLTGLALRKAENTFEAMQSRDANVELSSALKEYAVSLMKIANDLRLLYSGPRTGLGEIILPAIQPGSSIMPGKVNPVVPEMVNMVAAKVIGNDVTITVAGQAGNLDLNTMMPIIAYTLLESISILASASRTLARCVDGIVADRLRCLKYAESSVALITVLAPKIGYEEAAKIARKALEGGKSIRDLVVEEGLLTKEEANSVLNLKKLTEGGIIHA